MLNIVSSKYHRANLDDHVIGYKFVLNHLAVALISAYRDQKYFVNTLFVLMFVLDVSDVNVLDTSAFQLEEVVHILHKTDVDPQFKQNKSKKGTHQHILNNHENVNDKQICTLQLKEYCSAKCGRLNAKNTSAWYSMHQSRWAFQHMLNI